MVINTSMATMKRIPVRTRKLMIDMAETGDSGEKAIMRVEPDSNLATAGIRAAQRINSANVQIRMAQIFDELGMSEKKIAQKLIDKTEATDDRFFSEHGVVTDTRTVESHDTQLKAVDMINGLCGRKKSLNANLNINLDGDDLSKLSNDELNRMIVEAEGE